MTTHHSLPVYTHPIEERFTVMTTRQGMIVRTIGQGPALMLFHGGRGSWAHWLRNIDELSQHYTLFLPDLPSFGQSGTIPKETSMDDYISHVIEMIKEVFPDNQPFYLAGFSFGGMTAAGVASQLGPQVLRLSLLGPAGFRKGLSKPEGALSLHEGMTLDEERAVHKNNLIVMQFAQPETACEDTITIQHYNIKYARFNSLKPSFLCSLDDYLKDVTSPLQIILANQDAYMAVGKEESVARLQRIQPTMRMDYIEGAGHWAQYEAPETYNKLLLDFLET